MEYDLVTGGSGFIGSHLCDSLISQGRRVVSLDIQEPRHFNPLLEYVKHDVREPLPEISGTLRHVYHLAALADIVPSIERPCDYFETNVQGTVSVIDYARRHDAERFVYAASGSCYGASPAVPTNEAAPIDCAYPYAMSKYLGEETALHCGRVYSLPVTSLRLFNVYGLRSRTTGSYGAMFGVFLAQLLAGKPLTVVGDGEQARDFTHVSDVVDAFIRAANSPRSGVYNVGTGKPVTVNRIVELLGSPAVVHLPKRPGEPQVTQADPTRIALNLNWRGCVSIEAGVVELISHISDWSAAPVWDVRAIEEATREWFACLV